MNSLILEKKKIEQRLKPKYKRKRESDGEKREKKKSKKKEIHTHTLRTFCLDRSWRCLLQRGVGATRKLRAVSAPEARRTSPPGTRTKRITRTRVSSTRKYRRAARRIRYTRARNTWTGARTSRSRRRTRRRTRLFKSRPYARPVVPSSAAEIALPPLRVSLRQTLCKSICSRVTCYVFGISRLTSRSYAYLRGLSLSRGGSPGTGRVIPRSDRRVLPPVLIDWNYSEIVAETLVIKPRGNVRHYHRGVLIL